MAALTVLTDWPFSIKIDGTRSSVFWSDHALWSGAIATVLLLGVGVLTLDVPRLEREARSRRHVQDELHGSIALSLERCCEALGPWVAATRRVDDSAASSARISPPVRDLQIVVSRLIEDLRHWQMVALALGPDLDPRCAEILARQISLAKRARELLDTNATWLPQRKRRTMIEKVAGTISDLGANHELLTFATQDVVDVAPARHILSQSHDLGTVSDEEFVRRWGTLRTGLGHLKATGTPGTVVGVYFFHQPFDPRQCEWRELVEARWEAGERLRRGRLRLGVRGHPSLGTSTPGEGVRHQDVVELATE